MLELSAKTNLLEENDYRYSLQDVKDPVLYRDVYNYDEVPRWPSTTGGCLHPCLPISGSRTLPSGMASSP